MAETAFYVVGGAVVVLALLIAVLGLRSERFPGSGALGAAIVLLVAGMVVATGTFGWIYAAEHQRDYAPKLAEEREARTAERAAAMRGQLVEEDPEADVVDPVQVYDAAGCSGCHTLEAAGAVATVGPNLDETLSGRSPEYIEQQIVDPEAEVTPGFPAGVMPGNYEETLAPEELDALVEFLHQATN
jgi:mono/diheme cytochrome c family protein